MNDSIWYSEDGNKFKILSLEILSEQVWVNYIDIKTEQKYKCLFDYFQKKFWENTNERI